MTSAPSPGVAVAVGVDRALEGGQHPVGARERPQAAADRLGGHHPVGQQARHPVRRKPGEGR